MGQGGRAREDLSAGTSAIAGGGTEEGQEIEGLVVPLSHLMTRGMTPLSFSSTYTEVIHTAPRSQSVSTSHNQSPAASAGMPRSKGSPRRGLTHCVVVPAAHGEGFAASSLSIRKNRGVVTYGRMALGGRWFGSH